MPSTQELITECLGHQFNNNYSDRIIKYINEGQNKVISEAQIPVSQTAISFNTVAGENTYNLDIAQLMSIKNQDEDYILSRIDLNLFDRLNEETGTPFYYTIFGDEFALWPTPDAEYTLIVKAYEVSTPITLATDESILPDKYRYILKHYALARCYEAEHDEKWTVHHDNKFDAGLEKLKGELHNQYRDNQPSQVGGMMDY